MLKVLPAAIALLGLAACAAAPPPPTVAQQPCWEGTAPSCLPPVAGQPAAAAAIPQPGPHEDSSHAYITNPR